MRTGAGGHDVAIVGARSPQAAGNRSARSRRGAQRNDNQLRVCCGGAETAVQREGVVVAPGFAEGERCSPATLRQRRNPPTLPPGRRTHPARRRRRSASAIRRVRFLRSTETCERTLMHPFEFPESSDGGRAQATHLRPAEIEALARVAGLHTQLLDSPWTAHHGLTALRACPPPFMTDNFAQPKTALRQPRIVADMKPPMYPEQLWLPATARTQRHGPPRRGLPE
jgi:hypothetical protein